MIETTETEYFVVIQCAICGDGHEFEANEEASEAPPVCGRCEREMDAEAKYERDCERWENRMECMRIDRMVH